MWRACCRDAPRRSAQPSSFQCGAGERAAPRDSRNRGRHSARSIRDADRRTRWNRAYRSCSWRHRPQPSGPRAQHWPALPGAALRRRWSWRDSPSRRGSRLRSSEENSRVRAAEQPAQFRRAKSLRQAPSLSRILKGGTSTSRKRAPAKLLARKSSGLEFALASRAASHHGHDGRYLRQ